MNTKKNLYYRTVLRRRNVIKEFIYDLFLSGCSTPRMLLEVFIRKNFGQRYFSFSTAMIVTFVMAIMPLGFDFGFRALSHFGGSDGSFDLFAFLTHSLSWYLFQAGFVAMCIDRRREIKYLPSVFDFGKYSLSSGHIHPSFLNYRPYGELLSIRTIETLVEPGFFLVIGLALTLLQQSIGMVIVVCSICYSLSYLGAYHRGDNFVMDKIDEMLCNEELVNSFVEGRDPSETRGVNYYGRRPADPEARRKLAETFIESEELVEAR